MKSYLRSILLAIAVLSGTAHASFHLFDIQEVFSNSSGSVLFIELFTAQGGQQSIGGHTITFQINTTTQNTLTLTNLSSDTTNKSFLVGTANLTSLYGVTPDFVIPANFFTAGANNFINFGPNTDRVNLTNLPTDGVSSLNGLIANSGETSADTSVNAKATPTNFAGQTATIPEPGSYALLILAVGFNLLFRKRY